MLWIGYVGWVLGCAPFIADGLAAWVAPDFIGELQDRVAREGRAVTPADIADVVTRASGTLSARQLERLGTQLQGRIGHER